MRHAHAVDVVHVHIVLAFGELAFLVVELGERLLTTVGLVEGDGLLHLRNDFILAGCIAAQAGDRRQCQQQYRKTDIPTHKHTSLSWLEKWRARRDAGTRPWAPGRLNGRPRARVRSRSWVKPTGAPAPRQADSGSSSSSGSPT